MTAVPPQTRYAKSGKVSLAYQVVGEGPLDLVFCQGFVSNVDFWWEMPAAARLLHRLASFSRLIIWDKRGTGLGRALFEALTEMDCRAILPDIRVPTRGPGSSSFPATTTPTRSETATPSSTRSRSS
ncbi:MAG: hypothetical protein ACRDYV_04170 [Acidimicrobiia bacterium]